MHISQGSPTLMLEPSLLSLLSSPVIEAPARRWGLGQRVWLIECGSQAAVGPGTIAGKDHREGAAGHRDPLDIVLLPTDV